MSTRNSPERGDSDMDRTQADLLRQILDNQDAIQGLSDKLMPLLVSNLQRLAEASRPNDHPLQDSGTDGQVPCDPRRGRESVGQGRPAQQHHVAPSGEPDARMRGNLDRQNGDNGAQVHGNAAISGYDNLGTGSAAQNPQGSAARNYQGNAAQNYQGNAAQNPQGNAAQFYQGNAACSGREQMGMMNFPPWSYMGPFPPWGQWFFPPRPPAPGEGLAGNSTVCTPSQSSSPGPSGLDEDIVTPFISDSERGDLLFTDSEGSEDEEESAPPAKRLKLDSDATEFLNCATEKPLEHEKRKKLIARFPLPASDAAHPPKLDKDIAAVIPKSAITYDRLLSKIQQFNMDALGLLLDMLHRAKKGKFTARDLVASLEAAIKLAGNAAAHLSVERRKALMRHLNSDLRPLAEDDFSDRGPWLFGKDFASRAKSTADNVKALKGFIPKKSMKGFSGSGDRNKRKSFQPQGCRTYWGTQRHIQGQRFSVFNQLVPPLCQNPPAQKQAQHPKK